MKKFFFSLFAFCALAVSAQNEIVTFSVYDVNHDHVVTAEDVAKVVNHALKTDTDSPQAVDASALNALLQSIDNRLARIEEKLGIENDPHEYVDLGLPSGTLWATCNVGAESPEDYGDHFAWGETKPKKTYDWSTYFDSVNGSGTNFNKYSNNGDKTVLGLEDDAAYVNWGKNWRMPSFEQLDELRDTNNCNWTWTEINGKNGYLIESKHNDSSLFLPAAGYYVEEAFIHYSYEGFYWSRSLRAGNSDGAYRILFRPEGFDWTYARRCYGFSVRPIRVSASE